MSESDTLVNTVHTRVCDLFQGRRGVVLAASGGADSAAMVALLCEAELVDRRTSVIAHFDHRLRSRSESSADEAAVRALAERYGLRLRTGAWDDPRGGERAAREARYAFLARVAQSEGLRAVVTGHTADDQAETVLMHATRGAGLHGLAGMAPDASWPLTESALGAVGRRDLRLLRPLLGVSRTQTRAFCAERGIAYQDDATNDDRHYLRNRLRIDLLEGEPSLRESLLAMGESSRAALREIEPRARALLRAADDGSVRIARDELRAAGGLAPFALRAAVEWLLGDARDFERRHYALMSAAADAATGSELTLPRNVALTVDPSDIVLSRGPLRLPAVPPDLAAPLPWRGIAGAWQIEVRGGAAGDTALVLPRGAVVRARRPGDRVRPAGVRGSKKLQDYYIDRKVPRRERDAAPVIALAGDVLWVPFGRLAPWSGEGIACAVVAQRVA